MYFCGPTVYQRIHIGNARPFVLSMWLRRWLGLRGYRVTLAENVTDINDKIYEAARRLGIGSAELARQATGWYVEDTDRLGLGRPDVEPLASEAVADIVALTRELISRGLAYEAGGDVYFRVARVGDYGRLSGARPEDMTAQEPGPVKEDPRDFALWKGRKPHEDTWWESPWGRGRPGWHIECSAMAEKHLGVEFDIHGGGLDLRFPHSRERACPVPRRRAPVRPHLDAQRHDRARRREDVEVHRQYRLAPRGARPMGARDRPRLLPRRALPERASVLRRHHAGGARPGRRLPPGLPRRGGAAERSHSGTASPTRSTTTSTHPGLSPFSTAGAPPASSTSSTAAASRCSTRLRRPKATTRCAASPSRRPPSRWPSSRSWSSTRPSWPARPALRGPDPREDRHRPEIELRLPARPLRAPLTKAAPRRGGGSAIAARRPPG